MHAQAHYNGDYRTGIMYVLWIVYENRVEKFRRMVSWIGPL